ncbi:SLC13 family permease [Sphingopyxis sp.]|uniref:SLC13 family permease n=1 Tax=Sphingopyxis sp. TaxID=1908224 RepID=UPI002B47D622|nr:SLC13 family permease [Sphingopyxis sp.]HJS10504.1 SLC13 family permease [Sphingopyxis sp.]HKY80065.1 SLC13 family permease [Sphingobium sp.]
MSSAALSGLILVLILILFASERVRHDLVALIALFACLITGLVPVEQAFDGFADPAVVTVGAVLVVGRAIELSGAAALVTRGLISNHAPFPIQLGAVLPVGAVLSAFMNNIAALVITMPIAAEIGRRSGRRPAATLMPLAFATILGRMTTLSGTPANLILSSVREQRLGEPFGFFTMAPVGIAVAVVGLLYMVLVGWRLIPRRKASAQESIRPWRVFELDVSAARKPLSREALSGLLRNSGARLLAQFRHGERLAGDAAVAPGDRLLVLSRSARATMAGNSGLTLAEGSDSVPGEETARVVVAHGSFLIGHGHDMVRAESDGALRVAAAGPRAARQREPLARLRIQAGDQLYIRGTAPALAGFVARARLLELDRHDPSLSHDPRRMTMILAIFLGSVALAVSGVVSTAIAFLAAAALLAGSRLLSAEDIYRSIDWSIVVLLAAMIPVGQSFETSGAAAVVAEALGHVLAGAPPIAALAAICALTLLLSILLNNVATAIIMGPLALDTAALIGLGPDAALLAVLIGASSDFLTPIGHQNNLLVMGPGGYRFTDYARPGALLSVLVLGTAAGFLVVL